MTTRSSPFDAAARRPRRGASRAAAALGLCLLVAIGGCGKKDDAAAAKGPGGAPGGGKPPPEVGVVVAKAGDVGLVTELPGRLEASRVAQVRARVAGIVQKRLFREGSEVKAGQPLFTIDAAPYAASARSAQAALTRARANAAQAKSLADRYKPLVEANAISQQEYANALAQQKALQAEVDVARASVQTANINLGYARVTAPISGRIGRALVTEGALVGQGEATPLAVVQQTNPMLINFTQSANEALQLRRALGAGKLTRAEGKEAAAVDVVLEDGTAYAQKGKLQFSELTVDATTGQVTLRAEVPNPKGELLPGLYVRVRLVQAQASNAITVPQQAVTRSERGDTLNVVTPEGKLDKRTVKVDSAQGNRWVVTEGLKEGEQVMVDGFQRIGQLPPGATVKPVPWTPPAAKSANGAPASPGAGAGEGAAPGAAASGTASAEGASKGATKPGADAPAAKP